MAICKMSRVIFLNEGILSVETIRVSFWSDVTNEAMAGFVTNSKCCERCPLLSALQFIVKLGQSQ
jgi:hypothetical protein